MYEVFPNWGYKVITERETERISIFRASWRRFVEVRYEFGSKYDT